MVVPNRYKHYAIGVPLKYVTFAAADKIITK